MFHSFNICFHNYAVKIHFCGYFRNRDSPYFGHSICFTGKEDLYRWVAAMLYAQVRPSYFVLENTLKNTYKNKM